MSDCIKTNQVIEVWRISPSYLNTVIREKKDGKKLIRSALVSPTHVAPNPGQQAEFDFSAAMKVGICTYLSNLGISRHGATAVIKFIDNEMDEGTSKQILSYEFYKSQQKSGQDILGDEYSIMLAGQKIREKNKYRHIYEVGLWEKLSKESLDAIEVPNAKEDLVGSLKAQIKKTGLETGFSNFYEVQTGGAVRDVTNNVTKELKATFRVRRGWAHTVIHLHKLLSHLGKNWGALCEQS